MAVALASLRVAVEGDTSSYVSAMRDFGAATDNATASAKRLTDEQGRGFTVSNSAVTGYGNGSRALQALQRQLDPTYAAQQRFAKDQATLTRALDVGAISVDRYTQLHTALAKNFDQATSRVSPLTAAVGSLQMQMVAMAAGAGPVGVFLSALGPWGIGAAIGLGAVEKGFAAASDGAKHMGEVARMLRDTAQTMGVDTDQLQALNIVAASVGVSTDKNAMAFERFTVQLNELRKGSGTLLTELMGVDQSLVIQLAGTKDVTTAIDLLAGSYAQATDQIKKNAIARAAFGRAGFDEGRVLTSIDTAGGLDAYKNGLSATDRITQDQIAHWALLSIEIEHATTLAKNNLASIFTSPILEAQKEWADAFLGISRAAKEFSISGDLAKVLAYVSPSGTPGLSTKDILDISSLKNQRSNLETTQSKYEYQLGMGFDYHSTDAYLKRIKEIGDQLESIDQQLAKIEGRKIDAKLPAPASFDQRFGSLAPAITKPQFDLTIMTSWTNFMGNALSGSEKLKLKQLELAAAFDKLAPNVKSSEESLGRYARASEALKVDYLTTALNARIGALGMMANSTDVATQAQLKINKANLEGAGISKTQAGLIVQADLLKFSATKQNEDSLYGLASATDILNQKNLEFLSVANQLNYSESQRAAGLLVVARNAKNAYDASLVAASRFPQFTRAAIDAQDAYKQFDTLAVSGVDHLADSIVSLNSSTLSLGDTFKALGVLVINELEKMIIKMLIFKSLEPVMGASGGGLLGLLGLGGGSAAASSSSSLGTILPATTFVGPTLANGGVMTSGGLMPLNRYSGGGVATSPQLAMFGEGRTPEAYVPLPDGRSIPVNINVPTAMSGGGGSNVTIAPTYNVDARGSQMTAEQFQAILAKNNAKLTKEINKSLPDRVAAINRDPRSR